MNGDGKPDLIAYSLCRPAVWLAGNGDGTFREPVTIAKCRPEPSFTVGDVNLDRKADLVSAEQTCLGGGDGTFTAKEHAGMASRGSSVILRDFDGDGIPISRDASAPPWRPFASRGASVTAVLNRPSK
jgi:hypothetical protein